MEKTRKTILYARLSRDDGEDSVSNSIQNQRFLLEKYAKDNGLEPYQHIQDDGWSGTNWNRPGWQELMTEVGAGKVGIIITKNLDRMGRDYLRVGLYLEQFKEAGIRLIAINDNIDTFAGEDDFTPLRALFAEWYARDTSRKIRAVFKARTEAGYHCTGAIPYGYLHDPKDRQKWIVDEEAAKVIRYIFRLVIEGNGVYQIAKILEQEKIMIPSAHLQAIGADNNCRNNYSDPYLWRGGVVGRIVEREEYLGNKVLRKTYNDNFKQKRRKKNPKEECLVHEGAIPQIVDTETWHLAQKLRKTVRRGSISGAPPHRLTGLLYCADCGSKLTHDRGVDSHKVNGTKNHYVCGKYRTRTKECTIHFIRAEVMEELLLDTIRRISYYVKNHENDFIQRVSELSTIHHEQSIKESKKQLEKSRLRYDELFYLVKKLYESFATGKIPEKHFDKLITDYDEEQNTLEKIIKERQEEIEAWRAETTNTNEFIKLVKKYTDIEELSNQMVNEFVDKIVVHEREQVHSKRTQQIDIHFSFIGTFEIPQVDIPPSEREKQRAKELARLELEKREKQRISSTNRSRIHRAKYKGTAKHEADLAKRRAEYAAKKKAQTQLESVQI